MLSKHRVDDITYKINDLKKALASLQITVGRKEIDSDHKFEYKNANCLH